MTFKPETLTLANVHWLRDDALTHGDNATALDCGTWEEYLRHGQRPSEGCPEVCQRLCDVLNSAGAARGG